MPPLTSHHSAQTIKMLLIGPSGTGKTGALASLAAAGYKLRVIDTDNGLDILKNYLTNPASSYLKLNPKAAENVSYHTLTDQMKKMGNVLVPVKAVAWQRTMELLMEWKGEKGEENLGKPQDWGPDTVIVVDSLTRLSQAALSFYLQINGWLGQTRGGYDAQRDIGATQNLIRQFLALITDASLKCNVIVISHVTMMNEMGVRQAEGQPQQEQMGFPSAIGRALSPHIGEYFNNTLIAKTVGFGQAAKHKLCTAAQMIGGQIILAKSSSPLGVAPEYPLETGLADYFKALKGDLPK